MDATISCVRTVLTLSGRALCLTAYTLAGVIFAVLVYAGPSLFKYFVLNYYKSYVQYLPGPKRRGAFVPDFGIIMEAKTCKEFNERLARKYGLNVRIQGFGYMDQRLVTYDPVTINYILGSASDRFPKPIQMRRLIARFTGGDMTLKAINVTEGPSHHRLRKIVAPAFAPSTIRGHAPVFINKAAELCDQWRSVLSEPTAPTMPGVETDSKGNAILDINNWFGRLAFDVIGLAAFGYSFDSLRDNTNELFGAYMRLHFETRDGPSMRSNIALAWPGLAPFLQDETSDVIAESAQVVQKTSKAILQEMLDTNPEGDGKSILGLLLRSNANAVPEDRLTDEELLAQIDSFVFAGSDSTSLAITWTLYELARNPEVQQALRAELRPLGLNEHAGEQDFASDSGVDVDVGTPDHAAQFAAIDALPLLDRVVRESLRLHPSVQSTLRIAGEDDIVPFSIDSPPTMPDGSLSRAVVTGLGADGVERTGIRVRKGDFIHLPFEPMNSIRDMWGEDGHQFNPDRWLDLPAAAKKNPGVIAGLGTFSVGPHSCPAFRFAIAEMKTVVAYSIASFAFEETSHTIVPRSMMVNRPYVDQEWSKGYRLPLRVRAL
ncbi:cytochrome P450 family protein [Rhizoctonia solani AG-3 Rhs1AP]|uniref:Cytochrome P450 family protein n=2 Tax=Rhizoctonia solani AG-3 TaxID=1086053 RepID=A0A074STG2_9AGAM|nr:cytochrome P450 family protein [Rhizoctonia solani AG-3 Rhs1AP]KEP53212.1 cytochrome P450 family protein [Rhizoctonia solani 123E]